MPAYFVLASMLGRMRVKLFVLCLVAGMALVLLFNPSPLNAKEPLPSLQEAERLVTDGPEVLAAIAAMERDYQLSELQRQREGVRYFLNANFGYSNEPLYETSETSHSYKKLTVGAGLVFPLLGTWDKQKISTLEAEIKATEAKYRPQILKLHNLTALRKAYISLWAECQKSNMARRFLSTEAEVSRVLADRERKGLVLPADRLEMLTAYEMARRDIAVADLRKTRAMQIIRLVTGRLWDTPDSMSEIPALPDFRTLSFNIDEHPEIQMRKETMAKYEKLLDVTKRIDREANFTIGATAGKDFPGNTGTSIYASLNLGEPLGTLTSKQDRAKTAASEDLKRVRKEELFTRIRVEGEQEETFAYAEYAVVNIRTQEARLISMSEAVRERILRHLNIAGDTYERLQSSRYQYYRVAMDMLDSEMIFAQTGADLLSYAYPGGTATEPASRFRPIEDSPMRSRILDPDWMTEVKSIPGGNSVIKPLADNVPVQDTASGADFYAMTKKAPVVAPAPVAASQASPEKVEESYYFPDSVYVWKAAPFLNQATAKKELENIKAQGFLNVLLSLNGAEIANLDTPSGSGALNGLLLTAQQLGMRVDILLGDPHWLNITERPKLIAMVKKLANFKFGGMHLDIEPDSLEGAASMRPELLASLVSTVKEVKNNIRIPLSISMHPRYLEGELGLVSNREFGAVGLEYIAVMIYTTNRNSAAERFTQIALLNPLLKLKLAQSVEAALPPEESYASYGSRAFGLAMKDIADRISESASFKGIIIQSWEDYVGGGDKK